MHSGTQYRYYQGLGKGSKHPQQHTLEKNHKYFFSLLPCWYKLYYEVSITFCNAHSKCNS